MDANDVQLAGQCMAFRRSLCRQARYLPAILIREQFAPDTAKLRANGATG